jgi:hypothetical protein
MIMKRALAPLIMLSIGLGLGLLSAQYMMENASVASPVANSGWKEIQLADDSLKSSYLAGHFLRRGELPPPRGTRFFVRDSDDDGNSLRGDCLVTLEGKLPLSRWWFVSAASGVARSSLDVSQTVRETSGETAISLSIAPVPGNWLVPPSSGGYELRLVLLGIDDAPASPVPPLPRVKRLWC